MDLRKCEVCITDSRTVRTLYVLLANWHLAGAVASKMGLRWPDAREHFLLHILLLLPWRDAAGEL